jgi:GH24 family phage-related lysozyme (muramidase)
MNPPLLRYALHTKEGDPRHKAFWDALERLLSPEQQKRLEIGGDIREATWSKPESHLAAVALALPLVKEFEGCELRAYPDPETGAEPWTIGWGSTRYADGRPVQRGDRIEQEQADALLASRLERDGQLLAQRIPGWAHLSAHQQAALLSFTYNCGPNWYGSEGFATLSRRLREGALEQVPAALELYVNPGGPSEAGLRRRRRAEGALWKAEESQ